MQEFFVFVAGVVLGGLLSLLVAHRYYVKAGKEQKQEFSQLAGQLSPKNTLQDFQAMLEASTWAKNIVDHVEVWIADRDNTFQIVRSEQSQHFAERWTKAYPDQNSSAYPVYLKIGASVIKEVTFISMDGGRIFVPMADLRPLENNAVEYFWNLESLEVRLCRVIGEYYIYKNLEGVARVSKITLVQ